MTGKNIQQKQLIQLDILHTLPGRMRLKTSAPLCPQILYCPGITMVRYNSAIRTVLIAYNTKKISATKVIMHVAVGCAMTTKATMVQVNQGEEKKGLSIPPSSYGSLLMILFSWAAKVTSSPLAKVNQWLAMATTVGTIIQHGYQELKTKGTFDPEVMSVLYLLDACSKGNTLWAPAISWLATFGRHLLPPQSHRQLFSVQHPEGTDPAPQTYWVRPIPKAASSVSYASTFVRKCLTSCHLALGSKLVASSPMP